MTGSTQVICLGTRFRSFCNKLSVKNRSLISYRCGLITRRLNQRFWKVESTTSNRVYGGSYGRNTATGTQSDLDVLFKIPKSRYHELSKHTGNGQSALLQMVRNALLETYPLTSIKADGQIVSVTFTDDMIFEVVPVFEQDDKSFIYPDANNGGKWKTTRPRLEIDSINELDKSCNGNLKNLCKMTRAWKQRHKVSISGLLIDTLAYNFMNEYEYRDDPFDCYELMCYDFFNYLSDQDRNQKYWLSPGAKQFVFRKTDGLFETKAQSAKKIILQARDNIERGKVTKGFLMWKMLYGKDFSTE